MIDAITNFWQSLVSFADAPEVQDMFNSPIDFIEALAAGLGTVFGGITEAVIDVSTGAFSGVLTVILYILPNGGTFPQEFHDAALYFGSSLATINWYIPIDAFITCLMTVLLVKVSLFLVHIIRTGINFVRGIETSNRI